jgi:hypothetical protein
MVGTFGSRKIFTVAGITLRRISFKVLIFMAAFTADDPVGGVQSQAGSGPVIPLDGRPAFRVMAILALCAQPGFVAVILATDPMAGITILRSALNDPVEMARGAGHG